MKKIFKVENLDCPNCARKMHDSILKIEGVNDVSVNFLTQKLTLDADDNMFIEILEKALKACKKVDRDFEIVR